jgi:hypothetical protein
MVGRVDTCLIRQNGRSARGFSRLQPIGQGAPQTVALPPGQTKAAPAPHVSKRHPCSPARPFGHSSTQLEPAAHAALQLPSRQMKAQLLAGPQLQVPFAHSPSHGRFSPWHSTWHGPAAQVKVHELWGPQRQVPLAQVPLHSEAWSQVWWQGGLWHPSWQWLRGPQ